MKKNEINPNEKKGRNGRSSKEKERRERE